MDPTDARRDERDGALQELLRAVRARWTGQLFFSASGQVKGSVFVHQGRIAWAVSADHQEDLGTFLWRLGRVTEQQIAEVRRKYERYHGTRKLGSLLEEDGLIHRAALRRCLLLHTRMVVTSILTRRGLEVSSLDASLETDPEMTFEVGELLPELLAPERLERSAEEAQEAKEVEAAPAAREPTAPPEAQEAAAPRRWPWRRRTTMFDGFDQVEGFVGAAVVSSDGELIAADGRPSDFDPAMLGFFLASALDSIDRVASDSLGAATVVRVELARGAIAARWVDERKDHVVFVVLEHLGSTEAARYVLDIAAPTISRVIARWTERGWASPLPTSTPQT